MSGFLCRRVATEETSEGVGGLAEFATFEGVVMRPDDEGGKRASVCCDSLRFARWPSNGLRPP